MGANIENALLGQEQNMGIAITLWNDFSESVKAGQYEVGEFTKYIADMGYEITPGVQAGVDAIDEMNQKIEEARGTISDYITDVSGTITEGNQKMYDSGQLLEQSLSDEEKAVRDLQGETSKATAEYLENKKAKEEAGSKQNWRHYLSAKPEVQKRNRGNSRKPSRICKERGRSCRYERCFGRARSASGSSGHGCK